jgi:glucose/arabinose dehydrogenase
MGLVFVGPMVSLGLVTWPHGVVKAATLPPGFVETPVVTELDRPMTMAIAPDGRVFICEQTGAVKVVKDGVLLSDKFTTVPTLGNFERGLTGIALDPGFTTNGFMYLCYAPVDAASNVIVRVTASAANADIADPSSTVVLFHGPPHIGPNHFAGGLAFGVDGKLYATFGYNDTTNNSAQELTSLYGKLVRINPDGSIPTDNPFYNTASGNNRAIYAYGFRNPYTLAVQPGTGRIFVNDVGESSWEEVNDIIPGGNYGWPTYEGLSQPPALSPLWLYPHSEGLAVIGGAFYNPPVTQFPASFVGVYFVADYTQGWVKMIDLNQNNTVSTFRTPDGGALGPVSVKLAPDGSLYVLGRGGINDFPNLGVLVRIIYPSPIQSWRQTHFGSLENSGPGADEADPDFDGVLNVVEYGLGMDPNVTSRAGLPTGAIETHNNADFLTLTFTRNGDATDLTYTVEASGDLNTWTPVAGSIAGAVTSGPGFIAETGGGSLKSVQVRDVVQVTLAATRFVRLTVKRE